MENPLSAEDAAALFVDQMTQYKLLSAALHVKLGITEVLEEVRWQFSQIFVEPLDAFFTLGRHMRQGQLPKSHKELGAVRPGISVALSPAIKIWVQKCKENAGRGFYDLEIGFVFGDDAKYALYKTHLKAAEVLYSQETLAELDAKLTSKYQQMMWLLEALPGQAAQILSKSGLEDLKLILQKPKDDTVIVPSPARLVMPEQGITGLVKVSLQLPQKEGR